MSTTATTVLLFLPFDLTCAESADASTYDVPHDPVESSPTSFSSDPRLPSSSANCTSGFHSCVFLNAVASSGVANWYILYPYGSSITSTGEKPVRSAFPLTIIRVEPPSIPDIPSPVPFSLTIRERLAANASALSDGSGPGASVTSPVVSDPVTGATASVDGSVVPSVSVSCGRMKTQDCKSSKTTSASDANLHFFIYSA